MGAVESGVRTTLTELGILEPTTALECLAVHLANTLDNAEDEKNVAAVSRELRLTLEKIESRAGTNKDELDDIASKY